MKSRSFSLIMVFSVGLSVAVSSTVAGAGAGADFAGEEARVVSLIASMHLKDLFLYCCAVAVGGCAHLIFFFFFCCIFNSAEDNTYAWITSGESKSPKTP